MSYAPLVVKKDGDVVTVSARNLNVVGGGVQVSASNGAVSLDFSNVGGNLELLTENPASAVTPVASGANALALGSGSQALASGSLAIGDGSLGRLKNSLVFSSGKFAVQGDAQSGKYHLFAITSSSSPVEALNGWDSKLILPDHASWLFTIRVVGHQISSGEASAGYEMTGVISRRGLPTTTQLSSSKSVLYETNAAWDANVVADTTNGALSVFVVGEPSKSIRWLCSVETVEITS